MNRTELQNMIDLAYIQGHIHAADALAVASRMRTPDHSTADILADVHAALTRKAAEDGKTKLQVDAELAAALGLSTLL
jgi:hypothetical protein